jgi:hypothetical protein
MKTDGDVSPRHPRRRRFQRRPAIRAVFAYIEDKRDTGTYHQRRLARQSARRYDAIAQTATA